MSGHIWRACRREAGFSFIELLVTIVIAGIAFAAIVPTFLSAQSKNSDDNMRNIALQLARDKVEKIRQLPYEQITVGNLNSSSFADEQFGTTWDAHGGGGVSKTLGITYTVAGLPVGVPAAQQTVKQVTVTVRWTAPPSPVYPAVISTAVYKQFAGPQIVFFEIGPESILDETGPHTETFLIVGSPTVIDARISNLDIGSMIPLIGTPPSPNPNQDTWGYVHFTVTALNGAEVASADVKSPVSGDPGHYQWTWDNSLAPDGPYLFTATAYSSSGQQGNEVSYPYRIENRIPPAATGLIGAPGNGFVALTWAATTIGDLDHYVVYRSTDGVHFSEIATDVSVANYTDNTAVNGTDYWYQVKVVDTDGNESPLSAIAGPFRPFVPVDHDPPSVPGSPALMQVASQNALTLSWLISTDSGSPPSGVKGYDVERKLHGSPDWSQILSAQAFNQPTYTDMGLAWGTSYDYRVRAVDVAGNQGAWTATLTQSTVVQPKWNLVVANANTSAAISVWVQSLTTSSWWIGGVNPATFQVAKPGAKSIAKKKSVTWYQLPQDIYVISTAGGQSQTVTLLTNSTVSFSN